MTFKELVKMIYEIKTDRDRDKVCGMIDKSFENYKINSDEYELLYSLACIVRAYAEWCGADL